MATYTRQSGVQAGQTILLYAIFLDVTGNLISTDALPQIYIYDESVDQETIQAELDAETFTSAYAGPFTATELSTGYYKYTYATPAGVEGDWHDVWVADVSGVPAGDILNFSVSPATSISTQVISNNTMIVVELDSTIASDDGLKTLGEDLKLYFTTKYSPLYASPDLMRMEVGRWIEGLPDDTLALMIHWSSKEADFIHGAQAFVSSDLAFAKTKFVIYDACLRCLNMPGGGAVSASESVGGGKKQLGDLLIQTGAGTAADIDEKTIAWLEKQREEWFRVVNAGANIVPGGGLTPTFAVKGRYDPDRRVSGRLWEDPREVPYIVPTVNGRYASRSPDGRRRLRKRFGFGGP
jgi:hypothetical protein